MKKIPRWSIVTLATMFLLIGLFTQEDRSSMQASSYGSAPWGFKALVDLFAELEVPVDRNLTSPASLPSGTLWMIEPAHLCRTTDADENETVDAAIRTWVEAGGTLVAFLSSASVSGRSCGTIAGQAIPKMLPLDCKVIRDGDRCRTETATAAGQHRTYRIDDFGRLRRLRVDSLRRFEPSDQWAILASADGAPFVLERTIGLGRVVLVADARFLRNQWLDRGDSAVFAIDVANRFGHPLIDEWSHGHRAETSVIHYLARSPALALFAGIALTSIALFAYGAMIARRPLASESPAPSLTEAVDTLAAAYAATGEYEQLAERYREYAIAMLRQHLHLPTNASVDAVCDLLRARRVLDQQRESWLKAPPSSRSHHELAQAATRLDRLIAEVTG